MKKPPQLDRVLAATAMLALCIVANAQSKAKIYDGSWWMTETSEERAGFVDGFSDCAVWSAHDLSFNATPEQVVDKITDRYRRNSERSRTVEAVWKDVSLAPKIMLFGGEQWRNPHWYLNSDWWQQESADHKRAYIIGYRRCSETLNTTEKYSRSGRFYQRAIDSYFQTHGSKRKTAVATVLQGFQDSSASNSQ